MKSCWETNNNCSNLPQSQVTLPFILKNQSPYQRTFREAKLHLIPRTIINLLLQETTQRMATSPMSGGLEGIRPMETPNLCLVHHLLLYHSTEHPTKFCGKLRHQALDCFHHMDYSYEGKNPPSQLVALVARSHPSASTSNEEVPWYADSGTNNHVTAVLDNLTLQEPFKGDDEVAIGNDIGLSISHIGSFVLYDSKSLFQKPFKLNHILHCPTGAANLLSIHKFCVDNKCWFILTNSNFFVNDNLMGQTLLQGPSKDDLYPIHMSKSTNKVKKFAAFLGVSAPSWIWHSHLGHQSPPILNKIKQLAKLLVTGSSSIESLCEPCQLAKSKCLRFTASNNVTLEPLEIIHSDLWSWKRVLHNGLENIQLKA